MLRRSSPTLHRSATVLAISLALGTPACGGKPRAPMKPAATDASSLPKSSSSVLVNGDMLLDTASLRQVSVGPSSGGGPRTAAAEGYLDFSSVPWMNAMVPFEIGPGISASQQAMILEAAATWTTATGVRFQPRTDEDSFLSIVTNSAPQDNGLCNSLIGMGRRGGRRRLHLGQGCFDHGVILHEFGHALGLMHEHQRPDRDEWIEVQYANMDPSYFFTFQKLGSTYVRSTYDYFSIMHYSDLATSRSGGKTFTPLKLTNPSDASKIGKLTGLSPSDIATVRSLYRAWANGGPAPIALSADQTERLSALPPLTVASLNSEFTRTTGTPPPSPELYGMFGASPDDYAMLATDWLAMLKTLKLVTTPPPPVSISLIRPWGVYGTLYYVEVFGRFLTTADASRRLYVNCDSVPIGASIAYASDDQINFTLAPAAYQRTCNVTVVTNRGNTDPIPFNLPAAAGPQLRRLNPWGEYEGRRYFELFGNFPEEVTAPRRPLVVCDGQSIDARIEFSRVDQLNVSIPADRSGSCLFAVIGQGGVSPSLPFMIPTAPGP